MVLGDEDKNIKLIENFYNVKIEVNGSIVYCDDKTKVNVLKKVFESIISACETNGLIESQDVNNILNDNYYKEFIANGVGLKKFYLRTKGQKDLYEAFENNVITFAVGPAGTGKTFLAVVYAYNLLKKGIINKIIITRPVVESGESLGFLPGDLKEKVDPYLRPIYDSFDSLISSENTAKLIEKGILEIAPLAYMRGRTLNDACIILDEAQNTVPSQIKMFMTRLGFNSKMIINGDITQIDLPKSRQSGLVEAIKIIKDIKEIEVVYMSNKDVVRHPVVQKIIEAYEKAEKE
ncbi:MAG: PhoH family protein [Erysipelotrichia bacterium]|nr:PhoH family protein [Erysipelotrichia bacterium]